MLLYAISQLFSNLLFFVLHAAGVSSFPPPLDAKAETDLLLKAKNGDKDAHKKLIEHNLRLVAHISKKYYNNGVDSDDLISIGTIGLIKAVSTFSADKGIRLATYASRCIENEILMHFRFLKKSAQDVYIGDTVDTDKDGNNLTFNDIIADSEDIQAETELKMNLEKLRGFINTSLSAREKRIIYLRYGLQNGKEKTQREVACMLNISRSYVSRIEKAALKKLRHRFESSRR